MSDWYKRPVSYRNKHKDMTRAFRKRNPVNAWMSSVKGRARHLQLEYSLTDEDFLVPDNCPILGIPLYFTAGKRTDNTPSMDRFDPDKGYTKENTCVISWRANRLKCNATIDELKSILKYMETH